MFTDYEEALQQHTIIHKIERGDHAVLVVPDSDPQNPRTDCDNFGVLVTQHRRYDWTDDGAALPKNNDFRDWDDVEKYLRKERGAALILPVYLYDHSGVTISTKPFSCRWDSCRVGCIYATREQILKTYSLKRLTKAALKKAEALLQGEVETFDQYLTGQVYGIVEYHNGVETDSCWGFYGDEYAKEEAEATLKCAIAEATRPRTDAELGQLFLQFDPVI
jgi:hypothetical protein